MWIVRLALRRPYTFVVMSLLILILGTLAVYTTPIDIFPNIDIPIVAVIYGYAGLSAEDVSQRLVVGFERGLTATVNDVRAHRIAILERTRSHQDFLLPQRAY